MTSIHFYNDFKEFLLTSHVSLIGSHRDLNHVEQTSVSV